MDQQARMESLRTAIHHKVDALIYQPVSPSEVSQKIFGMISDVSFLNSVSGLKENMTVDELIAWFTEFHSKVLSYGGYSIVPAELLLPYLYREESSSQIRKYLSEEPLVTMRGLIWDRHQRLKEFCVVTKKWQPMSSALFSVCLEFGIPIKELSHKTPEAYRYSQAFIDVLRIHDQNSVIFDRLNNLKLEQQHSIRVAYYVAQALMCLNVTTKAFTDACTAALLHDVGKSEMPIELTYKPGKFSEAESMTFKQHVENSMRILREHGYSEDIIHLVEMHHASPSGGYPPEACKKTHDIYSAILRFSDILDAATSDRVYHAGEDFENAKSRIIMQLLQDKTIIDPTTLLCVKSIKPWPKTDYVVHGSLVKSTPR